MNEDSYPESSMAMRYWAIVCLEGNHKKNGVLGWIKCRDPSSHEDYDIVGAGFSAFEIGSSDPQVVSRFSILYMPELIQISVLKDTKPLEKLECSSISSCFAPTMTIPLILQTIWKGMGTAGHQPEILSISAVCLLPSLLSVNLLTKRRETFHVCSTSSAPSLRPHFLRVIVHAGDEYQSGPYLHHHDLRHL